MEERADHTATTADAYTAAKPSKFHFKSSSSRRKRRHDHGEDEKDHNHRSSKRHHSDPSSRHHRRRKHRAHSPDRHPTSTADGSYYDPTHRHRESLYDHISTSADATSDASTFRESLFDALADDEGAAYWEGVYGQPINIYPTSLPNAQGELERMTEDEYAEFVRARMWEKTHQHVVAEREARERARRERKAERERWEDEGEREEREREGMRRRMEESLRRGEERKRAKEGKKRWEAYVQRWGVLGDSKSSFLDLSTSDAETVHVADIIPWPVLSGKSKDIGTSEIERFLRAAPGWKEDSAALLKAERVRWHPDKLQRRFGQRIDEETIRQVTAVFQIIDQLWSARR